MASSDRQLRRGGRRAAVSARTVGVAVLVLVWLIVYTWRALAQHFALGTNAFDLSIFDYALWSANHGRFGHVPFIGQSLFSQHFMPTLVVLWPLHWLWPSPVLLIAIQLTSFAAAAVLLSRLVPVTVPPLASIAVVAAFLFGRRSHSAVTSWFYLESLEPLLVFAGLLAWRSGRRAWAALAAAAALGCKEDMAVYLILFGGAVFVTESRKAGALVAIGAAVWLVAALAVAIPAARSRDHLPPGSSIAESTMRSNDAIERAVERLRPARAGAATTELLASTGFVCLLEPSLATVALAGALATMAANPHSDASGLAGHYLFPVLAWLFAAAAGGAARVQRWSPRALRAIAALLLLGTAADSPLWHTFGRPDARERQLGAAARRSLELIPRDAAVLAMPNLVPHLAHRDAVQTIGRSLNPDEASYVAIAEIGDLWPLDAAAVRAEIAKYTADPRFTAISGAPLYVFRRTIP